ncbi:MAG: recombination mediator RecR [Clostridiales bacterium]|jgi:recombination protein RecR|nr:recombination mediator RecR [Clostridiales bacterium]
MRTHTQSIERLVNKFSSLGGVGKKTAMRYAYSIVSMSKHDVEDFCDALIDVKNKLQYCSVCATFAESAVCEICQSRASDTVCVVSFPKDVLSIERAGGYKGLYHVLHGTISPLDGRGPDELRIKELLQRLQNGNFGEVILATNPDIEGEATSMYISRLIKPLGIKVSRIAQGISMGSDIEFVDEVTLARAIDNRVEF